MRCLECDCLFGFCRCDPPCDWCSDMNDDEEKNKEK